MPDAPSTRADPSLIEATSRRWRNRLAREKASHLANPQCWQCGCEGATASVLPFHEARHRGHWNIRSDRSVMINTKRQPIGRRAASAGIIGLKEISAIKIASTDKPSSLARVRREYSLQAASYKPVCILKMLAQRLPSEHLAMSSEVRLHPILADVAGAFFSLRLPLAKLESGSLHGLLVEAH